MTKDDIVTFFDRTLKIRALHAFEAQTASQKDLEREFARLALDLLRRQPAMASAAGLLASPSGAADAVDPDPALPVSWAAAPRAC
jgi:hypothetical protein